MMAWYPGSQWQKLAFHLHKAANMSRVLPLTVCAGPGRVVPWGASLKEWTQGMMFGFEWSWQYSM